MFFDFSCTFDTVQLVRLTETLFVMQMDQDLAWTTNCLTNRLQYVKLQGCLSDTLTNSTLLPCFYRVYTSDICFNFRICHLLKLFG